MIIYLIIHSYDVDGGFGEAVNKEEILFEKMQKNTAENSTSRSFTIPPMQIFTQIVSA